MELIPHNFDDLWVLEQFLQKGDIISGHSTRSFKPKNSETTVRKNVFLELEVEKPEFHKFSGSLKVLGIILSGRPEEFVEIKAHHSLEIELNEKLRVKKKQLSEFELDLLRKAEKATLQPKLMVVLLDDEEATIAELKGFGFETKAKILAQRAGKGFADQAESKFFPEILKKIQDSRPESLLVAGMGFALDDFKKFLKDKAPALKASFESVNSVGHTGLSELLKRGVALKALQESEAAKESALMSEFLKELGKNTGLFAYGIDEVSKAIEAKAVKQLLVSQNSFFENRKLLEPLMRSCERAKAEVHVFVSKSDALQQLEGFGGFAALLKYKML